MKNKKFLIVFGIIALVVVFAIEINKNRKQTSDDNVIRIGAILPLTGSLSFVGESAHKGMMFALDENTTKGAGKLQFVVADGKSTAKDFIMAYRQVVTGGKLDALFCVTSVGAKAIAEQKPELPFYMTIVSDSEIVRDKPSWLNLGFNNEQEVDTIIDFVKCMGKSKISVVYQHDDLGAYTYETIKARQDIEFIAGDEVLDESQVPSIVAGICGKEPDVVFVAAVGSVAANIVKKLKEYQYEGMIASFSGFNTPSVLRQAGEAADGVYLCMTQYDIGISKEVIQFKEKYVKKYGVPPDFIAAYAYSLMQIYLTADVGTTQYKTLFGELKKETDGSIHFPLKVGCLRGGVVNVIE